MTWKPDYATLIELKAYLRDSAAVDDVLLASSITSASRAIDKRCGRQFGLTGSAVARVYTYAGECIDGRSALRIDDVQTTTGLAVVVDPGQDGTFETALTVSTDYDLWPWNAAADGKPWTHITLRPTAAARFPWTARGVQVTADFGWTTVPTIVKQACLIQASRFVLRREAPWGIAGSPDMGSELRLLSKLDPDVALMLSAVSRTWGAV